MTMMHRLGRFLNDLIGRAYFWIGSLLLIFPIAAYFPSRGIKRDLPGLWRTEDYIWLMFAGALLLLWAAFLEWNQQRELSLKLLRAEWARSERVGEPELELPSFPLLSLDEIAELRQPGSPSGFRAAGGSRHCAQRIRGADSRRYRLQLLGRRGGGIRCAIRRASRAPAFCRFVCSGFRFFWRS